MGSLITYLSIDLNVLGTVIRTTSVKMLETEKYFQCAKCHQIFSVSAEFEQYYMTPKPSRYALYGNLHF